MKKSNFSTTALAEKMIQYLNENFQTDIIDSKNTEAINEVVSSLKAQMSDYITQMLKAEKEEVTENSVNGYMSYIPDIVFTQVYDEVMDDTLARYDYELGTYEDLGVQDHLLDEVIDTLEATEGHPEFGDDHARKLLYTYYIVKTLGTDYIDEWVAHVSSPED